MNNMFPEPIYRHGIMRTTKPWRLKKQRYRLIGSKCKDCGQIWWPARKVCGKCNSRNMEDYALSHTGKLLVHHYGPMAWFLDPIQGFGVYGTDRVMSMVKLDEEQDVYITPTDMCDCDPESVRDDINVNMVFRKLRREPNGNWNYGFMWAPSELKKAEK